MSLEERIQRLEDIEAIRQLQAKYQRCLDTRDFEGLETCMAPDIVSSYDGGNHSYQGRGDVLGFLRRVMTRHLPSSHLIHGGEIELTGSQTAHAKWYLEDYLLHRLYLAKLHGTAIYDVDYVTETAAAAAGPRTWKISRIGYTRSYQYFERRSLINILTLAKTTFLDKMKR